MWSQAADREMKSRSIEEVWDGIDALPFATPASFPNLITHHRRQIQDLLAGGAFNGVDAGSGEGRIPGFEPLRGGGAALRSGSAADLELQIRRSSPVAQVPSAGGFRHQGAGNGDAVDGAEEGSDAERRHKRMIRNRESAARSRARKQAYTNELEMEVAHLLEENSRLKKQLDEMWKKMASQPPRRKKALHRASTATF